MDLLKEEFRLDSLDYEEQDKVYDIFKSSYEKATGSAWSRDKFMSRSRNWLFFGDSDGFVTVRPQNSGYYKLTGVAGNIKSILKGLNELNSLNVPVWGMATDEIVNILVKRFNYKTPNKIQAMIILKLIPSNVFGDIKYKVNKNGSITFSYSDVGESTKFFVANDLYYKKLKQNMIGKITPNFLKEVNGEVINDNIGLIDEVDIFNEARAVPNYKEDAYNTIRNYIQKYGYDNTYISFRSTANVSLINPNNKYDTPTGFYCYPLKSYAKGIVNCSNLSDFISLFPYQNELRFIFLFNIAKNDNVLFTSEFEDNKINEYVRKISNYYGKSNETIKEFCELFINNQFKFEYMKPINPTHELWLFIFAIGELLSNNPKNEFTKICYNIQLDGFVDDGCSKIIHQNEPCQGVFFYGLRNIMNDLIIINSHMERTDVDLTNNTTEEILKTIRAKLGNYSIEISSENMKKLIKNISVPIYIDGEYFFFDRNGNESIKGVDIDKIENSAILAGYFNTLLQTSKFKYVHNFGVYGGDVALATSRDNYNNTIYQLINRNGEKSVEGIYLDNIKYDDYQLRTAYFNSLLNTEKFLLVKIFGEYGGDVALAQITKNNGSKYIFIDKNGNESVESVEGVDIDKLINSEYRAAYFNTLLSTDEFQYVRNFGEFGGDVAMTQIYDGDNMVSYFINRKGERSVEGIDLNRLGFNDNSIRAAYFNSLLNTNKFISVYAFGEYYDTITLARIIEGNGSKFYFIDINGNFSVEGINSDSLSDHNFSSIRTAYNNTIEKLKSEKLVEYINKEIKRLFIINN